LLTCSTGSVSTPDAGSKLEPVQLFFASSGRIGIIVDIPDRQLGLDLTSLQRNMANAFEDGLNHTTCVLQSLFMKLDLT
jgi:hypothetical protein